MPTVQHIRSTKPLLGFPAILALVVIHFADALARPEHKQQQQHTPLCQDICPQTWVQCHEPLMGTLIASLPWLQVRVDLFKQVNTTTFCWRITTPATLRLSPCLRHCLWQSSWPRKASLQFWHTQSHLGQRGKVFYKGVRLPCVHLWYPPCDQQPQVPTGKWQG